jgi:glucose/mannose transport system permease protein
MIISFSVATIVSFLGIFFGLLGGYVLSRKKNMWIIAMFSLVLFGNYIPPSTKVLPALKIMQFVGLYDTIIGLAVSIGSMVLPLSTLLFRQFFIQIPESYFEAATIEGAHHLNLFRRIAVPLAKIPAFAVTVLTFAIGWNAYLIALVLTRGEAFERPIAITVVGLMEYAELYSTYNIMLAGGILASIPVVVLYLATQRYTTAGFRSLGALDK